MQIILGHSKLSLYFLLILVFLSCNKSSKYYNKGLRYYQDSSYVSAIEELSKVGDDHVKYGDAQSLIIQIDSLLQIEKRKQFVLDSIKLEKQNLYKDSLEVVVLKNAIAKIKSYKRFKCSSVDCLRSRMKIFHEWGKLYYQSKLTHTTFYSKQAESLGEQLKTHCVKLQLKEFPYMRSEFARISKNGLWEDDISVKNYGSRKTTIEFIGGFFSLNRNIKNFQDSFSPALSEFRFKKAIYKWSKYSDEYTYYNLNTPKDSDI